jgi:C4-dicarboxylate-specific signal transduction histidine kinase
MSEAIEATSAERLIELLGQQRDLYARLRELADQQRGLIASDRPERLLDVLRERQTLVGRLAQINMQLSPFRRNWNGTYGQLPEDARQRASALLDEINGMLQTILKADREDSALLAARKQAVASELGAVTGGRAANAAYAGAPTSSTADITG